MQKINWLEQSKTGSMHNKQILFHLLRDNNVIFGLLWQFTKSAKGLSVWG